jgi:hypothetical protein
VRVDGGRHRLCCWLGTMLSREGATERSYHELHVRSEIGLGAE